MGWMIQDGDKSRRMTWAELGQLYIDEGHRTALHGMAAIMRKMQRGYKTNKCYTCRRELVDETEGSVYIVRLQSNEHVYQCEGCKLLLEQVRTAAKGR